MRTLIVIVAVTFCCPLAGSAADVDYARDVKPVLRDRCYACHGALKQESSMRLDTVDSIRKGGDGGDVVQPGQADESELVRRIASQDEDERMPPEGKRLTAEQIAAIRAWIEAGAQGPADEQPEEDPRDHWSFRTPVAAEIPQVAGDWALNPIDCFIAARQQEQGITPVGPIEKSLLLRRAYLDLIGLPPTEEELTGFLGDERPDAWDRVVDRLLADPRYGERWGRHWMDVWRYTDWYGLGAQLRYSQKHIWHWRDWIIESLNKDKGYDEMIVEMLAADEIAPTDADTLRATGFLARNYFLFNRTTWLDKTIEHTSKAFLGLTMNCTKCHDHKYDPISQDDYYHMRAFFEPYQVRLDAVPGVTDLEQDGIPRVFDAHPDVPTYVDIRGNEKDPDTSRVMEPAVPALLKLDDLDVREVSLPAEAHQPGLRPFVLDDQLAAARQKIAAAETALAQAQDNVSRAESLSAVDVPEGELFLIDEFDEPRPDLWETVSGTWNYADGVVRQTDVGATRRYLRTLAEHPPDFEARLRFRTLGGERWKSVGLNFDAADGREKMVYLSAVQPGSKLQVSYNLGAGAQYPPDGKQDRPVSLGTWYEMDVLVRDKLVNVSINGQHALAYRLPVDREPGRMDVTAFDVDVEFDRIEVRALPPERPMIEPGASQPATPEQAHAELALAQAKLAAAELFPETLRTSWEADRTRFAGDATEEAIAQKVHAAALAARQYEAAQAEAAMADAKLKLATAAEDGREAAEKAVQEATQKLDAARAAVDEPGDSYTRVTASLKALEGPAETDESRRSPYPLVSTGRRTALARWIADRRNPLTARVAVNHIWMRHFGQPLVDPVDDFGRRTAAPPQQKLLDWLAVEFMNSGWSTKHLHRLIVTSQVYALSSNAGLADGPTRASDPTNRFYWRRLPVRVESQVVRDGMLHLAGVLNEELGGPTIDPKNEAAHRRSLYFTQSRDDRNEFVSMFDDADIEQCYRRSESIIPQQALALSNSRLSLEMARTLASRLDADGTLSREQFIREAFITVLSRAPDDAELQACLDMFDEFDDLEKADEMQARGALVHALFNHNDFVTVR
jgi:mono/diheme cytochrome c family protein